MVDHGKQHAFFMTLTYQVEVLQLTHLRYIPSLSLLAGVYLHCIYVKELLTLTVDLSCISEPELEFRRVNDGQE